MVACARLLLRLVLKMAWMAWTLALLATVVRAQQKVDADDVLYMQHNEFVKAVSTDDKATVEALLSTEAGQKSVHLADREEGLTALVRLVAPPHRHTAATTAASQGCVPATVCLCVSMSPPTTAQ